jgi:AraC-like DNA-binding protein
LVKVLSHLSERERSFALVFGMNRNPCVVGDIASLVGYAEHSSFHRAFRRYFSDTPGRVRRLFLAPRKPHAID